MYRKGHKSIFANQSLSERFVPIKCYGFPPIATQSYPELNDLSLAVEDFASRIFYLSPIRVPAQRRYIWSGSKPEGVGSHGEAAIQVLLANLIERKTLEQNDQDSIPDLIASIEQWMIRMGLAESFTVHSIHSKEYKVQLRVPGMTTMANLADVGVGVSQVLPVLILAHIAPEGSIIVLEQPESDLHPAAQAELADMFFEFGLKRNVQFIIETHSEYMLTRLQRRVAESDTDVSEDVSLYICRKGNSQSLIDPLKLDGFLQQRAKVVRPGFMQAIDTHWSNAPLHTNRLTPQHPGS